MRVQALTCFPLATYGTKEQQDSWLPDMLGGECVEVGVAAVGDPGLDAVDRVLAGRVVEGALLAALERASTFGRWNASGVRSILAAGAGVAQPTEPGDTLVIEVPATASRPLAAYRLDDLTGGL